MPTVNFHITGSADRLRMTLTVTDNGILLPGTREYNCGLPSLPLELEEQYQQWRQVYATWLQGIADLTPSSPPIEINMNVGILEECQQIGEKLIVAFNDWIDRAQDIQSIIQNNLVNIIPTSVYDRNRNNYLFILKTSTVDPALNLILQQLPFHEWSFIQQFYHHAEIAVSTTEYALSPPIEHQRLQVLVILGYDPDINLTDHQAAIGRYLDPNLADIIYHNCDAEDAIASLNNILTSSSPQVLFFIGHSESTNGFIRIYLNQTEYISPNDRAFRRIFQDLKLRGLIFSAWISCDGLGIAQKLSDLGIPYLLVSRERLPVHVAEELLDKFLAKATEPGVPIHIALSYVRRYLLEQIEPRRTIKGCPNVSNFPVLFQLPGQYSYILNPIIDPDPKLALPPETHQDKLSLLDRFKKFINSCSSRTWKFILFFIFGLGLVIFIWQYFHPPVSACDRTVQGISYISCGEKSLLGDENIDASGKKGMKELGEENPNLEKAIDDLETSWKNSQQNPEVLIALSNAKVKLEQQRAEEQHTTPPIVKTIAVMIPASASTSKKSMPIGFLAAVGEAQRAWNNTRHDWLLQTIVGNDENDPDIANKNVVKQIIDRRSIVGTVGPYSSHVAAGILPTYTRNKMTLISGTSTSIDLGRNHPFFFRTVSANNIQVDNIINFLKKKRIDKVELLHGIRAFSKSFKQDLLAKANQSNIRVNSSELTNPILSPSKVIKNFNLHQSQILILCPDALIDPADRENMKQIISINAGKIPIIGNEVVNEPWLFEQIEQEPDLGKNLILSLTWNENVDRINFSQSAYHAIPKWWRDKNKLIPHRTILTFDATNVLINAIDRAIKSKITKDEDIKTNLPEMIRQVTNNGMEGITGEITFKGSDRVENLRGFSKPKFDRNGKLTGYELVN